MAADTADFRLTFGNSMVGIKVHALEQPVRHQVTEAKIIHGFRHKQVLINNRFPAVVYEFPFVVYTQGSSVVGYVDEFYKIDWLWDLASAGATNPRTLVITNSSGTGLLDFGLCYFAGEVELKEPSSLLLHAAGLVGVKFMGSKAPARL